MPTCNVAQGMMVVCPWKMNWRPPFKRKSTKYYVSGLKWKYIGKELLGMKSECESPWNRPQNPHWVYLPSHIAIASAPWPMAKNPLNGKYKGKSEFSDLKI